MLSGIKEIIIIILVLAGLFILPRMLRRGAAGKTDDATRSSTPKGRGWMRLFLFLSLFWLALAAFLFNPFRDGLTMYLGIGILPVGLGWGIRWVVLGFK